MLFRSRNTASVSVTEAVLRVSCGADNYVPVAKVTNLANALRLAKQAGFTIIGAVVKDGQPLDEIEFPFPLGIVIGSEQKGVREIIRRQLDGQLTIPMAGGALTLNVSHAATIIGYEVTRQKKNKKSF